MLNRSDKYKYKIIQYLKDIPNPRRGEVVIVPQDNRIVEFPPFTASSALPKWWSGLPKNRGSLRRCQGTYDYTSAGFFVPLWTDVTIRPDAGGKNFEVKLATMDNFEGFRYAGFSAESSSSCPITSHRAIPSAQFPKLVSPWRFKTPKGVSLLVLPVLHEPNPNYTVVPGIVHTDFYSQIHVVINVLTDKEFTIPAGTVVQQMIPFRRTDNTKKIIWGNESMFKFLVGSGLGPGCVIEEKGSNYYRKKQKDLEEESLNKKWYSFFKK
jgi:hypothetical protein